MITQKILQKKLTELTNQTEIKISLDYAACYGGYCLTSDKGSHHITERMPAKEMLAYLKGAISWSIKGITT